MNRPTSRILPPRGPYVQHWAGPWSLLSCSYFGTYYTHTVAELLETRIPHCVLTYSRGRSACHFAKTELDAFGVDLADQARRHPAVIRKWADELKFESDAIRAALKRLETKATDAKSMGRFEASLRNYTAPHLAVKKAVDYLPASALKTALPVLEKARLYSETVYGQTEAFMKKAVARIAKETGRTPQQIETLTHKELDHYFKTGRLPNVKTLEERYHAAALVFEEGDFQVVQGPAATRLEKSLARTEDGGVIRGSCAHPGHASGIARVVLDPAKPGEFNVGDILVTGMTRPEYLPLFKKAGAVITDAGGILSHAAIVARELKKPCVIGTQDATKRIKNGQRVRVDAKGGIISTT
ncbi:hypothetical protein HYV43_03100 [Candidatus Micrarchaeota archaeon]|nr:hypothetical protein [Candidatus Micrarchaeota archaeon]